MLDHIDSKTGYDTSQVEFYQRLMMAGSNAMDRVVEEASAKIKELPEDSRPDIYALIDYGINMVTENQHICEISLYTNRCHPDYRYDVVDQIVVDALKRMFIPPDAADPMDIRLRWYYDGRYRKEYVHADHRAPLLSVDLNIVAGPTF